MTLVGLGSPLIPALVEGGAGPCPKTRVRPSLHPLVIRPHTQAQLLSRCSSTGGVPACFFKILHQVPPAVAVLCPDPATSRKSSSSSSTPPDLLNNRHLLESRIKSLRLEIGDLSIAENLEKLCDHYFKLDLENKNKARSDEFNRKLSLLLNEKASESGQKSPTVTFDLDFDLETPSDSRKPSSQISCSPFGATFHGQLSKSETESRLQADGEYLIRTLRKEPESYILSFRCNGFIQNFRIYKDPEFCDLFYLEDRKVCYASLNEMVNEGLQTLWLDLRAGSYIDTLTELARINREATNTPQPLAVLPSPCRGKSIYVGVVGVGSSPTLVRRSSVLPLQQGQDQDQAAPELESLDTVANPLLFHFFLPGTINLDKKSPCDLETCPLRVKTSFCSRGPTPSNLPSGKETLVCRDCGLTIHTKCQDRLLTSSLLSCLPDMYKIPEIFGADLTTLVKAGMTLAASLDESGQSSHPQPLPPFVVVKCVTEIERRGLNSEGMYRIPGSQDIVRKMQHVLERDRTNANLIPFSDTDSLCGLLKMYLRQLPESLISREVFAKFMQDSSDNIPLTLSSTREHFLSLPPAHKTTLRYLLTHFTRVVEARESNKMSAYNLAVVLVPSLIMPDDMTLITLKIATDVVDLLLRNHASFDFLGP